MRKICFYLLLSAISLPGMEFTYRVAACIDTGLYDRKDFQVETKIAADAFANSAGVAYQVLNEENKLIDKGFAQFVDGQAAIRWQIAGKLPALTEKNYWIEMRSEKNLPADWQPPPDDNLIPDGSFEGQPGEFWPNRCNVWETAGPADDIVRTGKQSWKLSALQIRKDGRHFVEQASGKFPLKPNTEYSLTAYTYAPDADFADGSAVFSLYFGQAEGGIKIEGQYYRKFLAWYNSEKTTPRESVVNRWIGKSIRFTTPSWTSFGQIRLGHNSQGSIYFDDAVLIEVKGDAVKVKLGQLERMP